MTAPLTFFLALLHPRHHSRVKLLVNSPAPDSCKKIKNFIAIWSLLNSSQFIQGFSTVAAFLKLLNSVNIRFEWVSRQNGFLRSSNVSSGQPPSSPFLTPGARSWSRWTPVMLGWGAETPSLFLLFLQALLCCKKLWHWESGAASCQTNLEGLKILAGWGLDKSPQPGLHF